MYRVRPRDDEAYVRSDEDVRDKELVLTDDDFEEMLNTKIGGRDAETATQRTHAGDGKATHEEALQRLLKILVKSGRRREAKKRYTYFTEQLEKDMGLEPLPSTQAILDT